MSNRKHWLLTISGGSDGDPQTMRAGVDLALAAGAFGQQVTLVFSGAALPFLGDTAPSEEALYRLLGSLPYYDIEQVYALNGAEEHASYREDISITPLTPRQWSNAASKADIAVNY